MTLSDLNISNIQDTDCEEFAAILKDVFFNLSRTEKEIKEELIWRFFKNPVGKIIGSVARDKTNKIIGGYGMIPLKVKLSDKEKILYLGCLNVVAPKERGKGISKILFEDFKQKLLQEGKSTLISGFPSDIAQKIGQKHFSYLQVLKFYYYKVPLTCMNLSLVLGKDKSLRTKIIRNIFYRIFYPIIKAVQFRPYLYEKISSDFHVSQIYSPPSDIEDLISEANKHYKNIVIRSREFLQWRLFDEPTKLISVYEIRKQNKLIAYFALELRRFAKVVDILCLPGENFEQIALSYMLKIVAQYKQYAFLDFPIYDDVFQELLLKFQASIRDIESFSVRNFNEGDKETVDLLLDNSAWYLTGSESIIS